MGPHQAWDCFLNTTVIAGNTSVWLKVTTKGTKLKPAITLWHPGRSYHHLNLLHFIALFTIKTRHFFKLCNAKHIAKQIGSPCFWVLIWHFLLKCYSLANASNKIAFYSHFYMKKKTIITVQVADHFTFLKHKSNTWHVRVKYSTGGLNFFLRPKIAHPKTLIFIWIIWFLDAHKIN